MSIKTISGSYANGYTLAAKYAGVSITSTGTVRSAHGANATYYSGHGGSAGAALTLPQGGDVINDGQVAGGRGGFGGEASYYDFDVNGGAAGAGGAGIVLAASGSVTNRSSIVGGAGGVGGAGSPGYYYGFGGDGGSGGAGGAGIVLKAGGVVTNLGAITGGAGGAGGAPGGVYAYYGRDGAGGTAVMLSAAGSVTNLGQIIGGKGAYFAPDGAGVVLSLGGRVTNGSASNSSALIEGDVGVSVAGTGTVINFATIAGTGAAAVRFASSSDRLIAETGSKFVGKILGGGGTLELAAASGTISGLGATGRLAGGVSAAFSNFGVLIVDAGTSWSLAGTNTVGGANRLTVNGALSIGAGSLTNLSGGTLTGGTFVVGAGGRLQLPDNTPLTTLDARLLFAGPGAVVQSLNTTSSTEVSLRTSLIKIAAGGILEVTGGGSLALAPGGGTLTNLGLLEVAGGALTVNGAVLGTGSAKIAGGLLDFTSSFNQHVAFNGSGELELARSQTYAATISGFSHTGADKLDLRDIAPFAPGGATTASYAGNASGGVLTVTDGVHTAHIHFIGDYTTATWTLSSDGHGGTIVVDPVASAQPAVARFATAMAGFGAPAGAVASSNAQAWGMRPAALAVPRTHAT